MDANIQFATCQWEDLPGRFDDRFDLVLCVGNSISHTPNKFATIRALAAMRAVLKPNGKLLLATRNWEKLRRENVRASVANTVLERDGMRRYSESVSYLRSFCRVAEAVGMPPRDPQ